MNRVLSFFQRQQGIIANDYSYDFALQRLCVAKNDSWRGITPSNYSSDYNPEPPILAAKFANCDGYRHIIAIANEDGKIALQDTTKRNEDMEERALSAPQCHFNAVFDLEWVPGQMKFVSASGDHAARLWEIDGGEIRIIRTFNGHTRSVKTVAFRKSDASVFATGGRDGAIIIWDTRAKLNIDLTTRADNCIYSGHSGGPGTPVSQKKRLRTPKLHPPVTSSSITGLVFQDNTTLVSCGAGDGIIKVWDMRRNYSAYKKEPLPKFSLPYAGSSTFKGFTNLLIDDANAKLYANCMDNTIYCYNLNSYSAHPLTTYTGMRNNTFYIKSCLSPDGKYLLSGSSDERAYIWNLNNSEPLVSLCGHTVEVTCVAWGSTHDHPIVTCSDDSRHKIWRIGPEQMNDEEKLYYRGHAEFLRTYNRVLGPMHKYNLRDLESTPRSLRRIVEQNEKTPNSVEKISTKRSFMEMMGCITDDEVMRALPQAGCNDQKRFKTIESKGRRLFGPSTSTAQRCLNLNLSSIAEDRRSPIQNHTENSNQENSMLPTNDDFEENSVNMTEGRLLSPLCERMQGNTHASSMQSPTTPSNGGTLTTSNTQSLIFSPTTNLPNYVLNGDAPHLTILSPKRKHKDKVDWLTKIRKQKLMSSYRGSTISDKITNNDDTMTHFVVDDVSGGDYLSSPRLQSLRASDGSPRTTSPSRRSFRAGSHGSDHPKSPNSIPKTPTSSRRRSETSILKFFTIQQEQKKHESTEQDSSSQLLINNSELEATSSSSTSVQQRQLFSNQCQSKTSTSTAFI